MFFLIWSLDLFIRAPFRLYGGHTSIKALGTYRTHCHLCLPMTHLHLSEVKCVSVKYLAQGHKHPNNVPTSRGERYQIYRETWTKWGLDLHYRQWQLQSANALTIASRPLICNGNWTIKEHSISSCTIKYSTCPQILYKAKIKGIELRNNHMIKCDKSGIIH